MPSTHRFFPAAALRRFALGLSLSLGLTKPGRAEDTFSLKAQSWQETDGRIRVDSQYATLESDLSTSTRAKVMGLIDTIAGATPTGETPRTPGGPLPLATMHDRRKAWDAELSHQFARVSVTAGFANSRESDYVSNGWSVNTVTDFNSKNTGLMLGYGRTDDLINEEKLGWTVRRPKTGNDLMAGVRQLLSPDTVVSVNLTWGRSHGYMSDPYKIVSTTRLDLDPGLYYTVPENRPTEKDRVVLFLGANHNLEKYHAALDASYRFYHDSFGITSHTLSLLWLQKFGDNLVVQPSVRIYRQSAADFYYPDLDAAGIITTYEPVLGETGTGRAPYYSSDNRLAEMLTLDCGLKVVWKIKPWVAVDAAYNRYTSRGLDHVTPADAFCRANVFTVGLKFTH